MSTSVRKIKNKHKRSELNRIFEDKSKKTRFILLAFGILLIGISLFIPRIEKISSQPVLSNITANSTVTSFSQEPVKIDKTIISGQASKTKNPPVRIVYPLLEIDLPVRQARIIKGYWEVFPDTAGYGTGSSYPDETGNQVIFAHARPGLFAPLKQAQNGQSVFVFTKDKWYQYTVVDIKEVLPSQVEVIAPTKETILTLYTCSGYANSKRLIVTAKRVS